MDKLEKEENKIYTDARVEKGMHELLIAFVQLNRLREEIYKIIDDDKSKESLLHLAKDLDTATNKLNLGQMLLDEFLTLNDFEKL